MGVTYKTCTAVGSLAKCSSTSQRLSVSDGWLRGITACNSKKLHDKMSDHERSKAHESCTEAMSLTVYIQLILHDM